MIRGSGQRRNQPASGALPSGSPLADIKPRPSGLRSFRIVAASEEHPIAEVVHQVVRTRMPMVPRHRLPHPWLLTDLDRSPHPDPARAACASMPISNTTTITFARAAAASSISGKRRTQCTAHP